MPSYTEENYLKAIYKLAEASPGLDVSTNSVSEALQTRPASVTDMLRRLGEKGLLNYQRYRGVSLTPEGKRLALLTIRKHRLWEVFLVQQLGFSWDEVHEVAEELEHIQSPLLVQRLDEFLGYPQTDPHGDPIPAADGSINRARHRLVADLAVGEEGTIVAVRSTAVPFLQYLDKVGLRLGSQLKVIDKIDFDNSLEVSIDCQRKQMLSAEVSRNLFVAG
ncbi:metal-dependent transcriptional regulator [Hymenobacter lutimineralis]|uniref:Transcriptional regulator MntR n=1 Tax=Hymenobacter lutimineralis TaxID=2606448 RepID=A0A5D6US14_9BACT|nr:metal-dependent transcriptional regulator [Hymenobacter lutimineralis]TYZ06336.1 metal-dependent transcriptional regulator [Hymenobacter lutimineralis]